MKTIRSLLLVFALTAPVLAISSFAQVAAPAAAVAAPGSNAMTDVVALVAAYVPSWLTTALSIFGTVSLGYQALIAWAHKRAAETADTADDNWLASLDAKPWFKILDRIFYWGGYIGSRMGGKKL